VTVPLVQSSASGEQHVRGDGKRSNKPWLIARQGFIPVGREADV